MCVCVEFSNDDGDGDGDEDDNVDIHVKILVLSCEKCDKCFMFSNQAFLQEIPVKHINNDTMLELSDFELMLTLFYMFCWKWLYENVNKLKYVFERLS